MYIEQTEIQMSGQTALVLYEDLFMCLCYLAAAPVNPS